LFFTDIYRESVITQVKLNCGQYLTVGSIYKSHSSSKPEVQNMCRLIDAVVNEVKNKIILIGDFNFPDIDWTTYLSNTNNNNSNLFLDTLYTNLLSQHVVGR
jgi:hypothetical protein